MNQVFFYDQVSILHLNGEEMVPRCTEEDEEDAPGIHMGLL